MPRPLKPPPSWLQESVHAARKLAIGVIGGTVVLIGLAMLVLPGPAVVVVPLGLAILATEFAWARRLLKRVRHAIEQRWAAATGAAAPGAPPPASPHASPPASPPGGSEPPAG